MNSTIIQYLLSSELCPVSETTNQDWWYVQKHLTEEKGWVPAQYLMDEANYTLYLQKKLNEKIDKLPVFESKQSQLNNTYLEEVTTLPRRYV